MKAAGFEDLMAVELLKRRIIRAGFDLERIDFLIRESSYKEACLEAYKTTKLIDDKIGFKDLNAGFDKLEDGKVVRQILIPSM